MPELREIRIQTDPTAEIRTETFMGREYLVAPVVMLVEGVVQGANAENPEYCSADVLERFAHQWDGRPVVMNHPQVQGTYVSANSPAVMQDWAFGFLANTTFDSPKLKSEAWIDVARAEELGGDFQSAVERIQEGKATVEVSTGLFVDIIQTKGKFRGQAYTGAWTGLVSDHLAILSEGIIGACSVDGGCGIPRINQQAEGPWGTRPGDMRINTAALRTIYTQEDHDGHCCATCKGAAMTVQTEEMPAEAIWVEPTEQELAVLQARASILVHTIPDTITHEDARKLVNAALCKRLNKTYIYAAALTSNVVVYESYSCGYGCSYGCSCGHTSRYGYWQLEYSISDDGVVTFTDEPQEVVLMTKITPVVNSLEGAQPQDGSTPSIQEGSDDMSTGSGQAGQEAAPTAVPVTPNVNAAPATETPQSEIQVQSQQETQQEVQPMALQAWLDSAPPEVSSLLREALTVNASRKTTLITAIKANAANIFTDEQLNAFSIDQLEGISKLSVNSQPAVGGDLGRMNYAGRGGFAPQPTVNSGQGDQPADMNSNGGRAAPKVFSAPEDFSAHRPGVHKR